MVIWVKGLYAGCVHILTSVFTSPKQPFCTVAVFNRKDICKAMAVDEWERVASQVKDLQMNMQVTHLRKSFGPLLEDLDDEQCDLFFSYMYVDI